MQKKLLLLLSVIAIVGCTRTVPRTVELPHIPTVTIKNHTVSVMLARTETEQEQGLGGVAELGWNEGMFFIFSDTAQRTFWMKGMLIPIDIIWIHAGTVVGLSANVPIAAPGTLDAALPLYASPEPVDYVLETRAGFIEKYGVKSGDAVTIDI